MKEFIDRLASASEPSRILDWEIHVRNGLNGVGSCGEHPQYTSSLDAAMSLKPEGYQAYVDTGVWDQAHACVWTDRPHRISGGAVKAATPAIALCVAVMRAKQNSR